MKKTLVLLCLWGSLLLTGCRTFYVNQAIKAPDRQFEQKLPNLEPVFENEKEVKHWKPGEKLVRENSHWATLFYRDIEKNVIDPYGERKGYIVLRPIIHQQTQTGWGWYFLSICTLTIPNLLGMPILSNTGFAELEMDVLNKKGELIKRYSAEMEDVEYVAMWWGYSEAGSANAALYTSYSKALEYLVNQVNEDKAYLIKKLQ